MRRHRFEPEGTGKVVPSRPTAPQPVCGRPGRGQGLWAPNPTRWGFWVQTCLGGVHGEITWDSETWRVSPRWRYLPGFQRPDLVTTCDIPGQASSSLISDSASNLPDLQLPSLFSFNSATLCNALLANPLSPLTFVFPTNPSRKSSALEGPGHLLAPYLHVSSQTPLEKLSSTDGLVVTRSKRAPSQPSNCFLFLLSAHLPAS